jgi:hypothetical protein
MNTSSFNIGNKKFALAVPKIPSLFLLQAAVGSPTPITLNAPQKVEAACAKPVNDEIDAICKENKNKKSEFRSLTDSYTGKLMEYRRNNPSVNSIAENFYTSVGNQNQFSTAFKKVAEKRFSYEKGKMGEALALGWCMGICGASGGGLVGGLVGGAIGGLIALRTGSATAAITGGSIGAWVGAGLAGLGSAYLAGSSSYKQFKYNQTIEGMRQQSNEEIETFNKNLDEETVIKLDNVFYKKTN